jgi:hypothetical protein
MLPPRLHLARAVRGPLLKVAAVPAPAQEAAAAAVPLGSAPLLSLDQAAAAGDVPAV